MRLEMNFSNSFYDITMETDDALSERKCHNENWELESLMLQLMLSQVYRSLLLSVCIALCLWYYFVSWHHNVRSCLPPGSMGLPIIGETIMFILKGTKFYESKLKQHGPIFKTHLLGTPVIRVVGAENVKKILLGENDLVTAYWPASVRMLLGEKTLSMCRGDDHRRRRRAMMQAFSHSALSRYTGIMQQIVRGALRSWCDKVVVLGYQECRKMTFDLAAQALVGFRLQPTEASELICNYDMFTNNLFSFPFKFPGMGIVKGMFARKVLLEKIEECLQNKKDNFSEDSDDAMSRLLKARGEDALDLDELKEMSLELLFAGHSTTASAATSLLLHLHDNALVVDTILEELGHFGLTNEDGLDLNLDILNKLTYVSAVVKEVLRVAPPVGAGFRTVLKSFTLNGYTIPAGWMVAYSIRETQQSTTIFKNPESFEPSRWLQPNERDTKYHFLPFGGGARTCVGKEFAQIFLRIFVVELVRSCHWRITGSRSMATFPVPHPVDNLPAVFTYRSQSGNKENV